MGNTPRRKKRPAAPPAQKRRRQGAPWVKYVVGAGVLGALGLMVVFISADVSGNPQGIPEPPQGVQYFAIDDYTHTELPVNYPTDPPVGGSHSETPLECRAYDVPVRNENAIHALEHGAVWIAYQPDLAESSVATLEGFAGRRGEVIVSPYPGIASPIVLSAWGAQLELDDADDPRVDTFVRAFENQLAPENAAGC